MTRVIDDAIIEQASERLPRQTALFNDDLLLCGAAEAVKLTDKSPHRAAREPEVLIAGDVRAGQTREMPPRVPMRARRIAGAPFLPGRIRGHQPDDDLAVPLHFQRKMRVQDGIAGCHL
jgi:hypothetical protein